MDHSARHVQLNPQGAKTLKIQYGNPPVVHHSTLTGVTENWRVRSVGGRHRKIREKTGVFTADTETLRERSVRVPMDGDLKGYLSGRSTRTFHTPPSYGAGEANTGLHRSHDGGGAR